MSRPRYDWWGYAKGMIRRYPLLQAELEALQAPTMTAAYDSIRVGGGRSGDPTASGAVRQLPGNRGREYDAVTDAIGQTMARWDGRERMKMVEIVFWRRSHTLTGAAETLHISRRTAERWHGEFIRAVARSYGLLD